MLHSWHDERQQAEVFIRDVFTKKYGANITHFMPHLIRLCYDQTSECYSVAGYQEADAGVLFVEQYLPEPVERILSYRVGQNIPRQMIVEVGNFAEAGPGGGRDAIIALVSFLFGAGYQWAVVTAVPKLANGFRRLGLRYVELGEADPKCLSESQKLAWGSYYDHSPKINAADLRMTYRVLEVLSHDLPSGSRGMMQQARTLGLAWRRQLDADRAL
ncbi:MAG: thermostable hemolysin [Mariprofundaceae bacterium]